MRRSAGGNLKVVRLPLDGLHGAAGRRVHMHPVRTRRRRPGSDDDAQEARVITEGPGVAFINSISCPAVEGGKRSCFPITKGVSHQFCRSRCPPGKSPRERQPGHPFQILPDRSMG